MSSLNGPSYNPSNFVPALLGISVTLIIAGAIIIILNLANKDPDARVQQETIDNEEWCVSQMAQPGEELQLIGQGQGAYYIIAMASGKFMVMEPCE